MVYRPLYWRSHDSALNFLFQLYPAPITIKSLTQWGNVALHVIFEVWSYESKCFIEHTFFCRIALISTFLLLIVRLSAKS